MQFSPQHYGTSVLDYKGKFVILVQSWSGPSCNVRSLSSRAWTTLSHMANTTRGLDVLLGNVAILDLLFVLAWLGPLFRPCIVTAVD